MLSFLEKRSVIKTIAFENKSLKKQYENKI